MTDASATRHMWIYFTYRQLKQLNGLDTLCRIKGTTTTTIRNIRI